MNIQDKVLEIMEQIFNSAQKKNSVVYLNPKLDERFECTSDSDCKRCPEWLKSKPQHGWKPNFIVEAENAKEEARRKQWRGDWCGECFYEGERTSCTCGGGPLAEMSHFRQDMNLVEHFRRVSDYTEFCDCERCDGMSNLEAKEMANEIAEYWDDVERDTH